MKNIKYLLLVIPFLFISNVKANTIDYNYYFRSSSDSFSLVWMSYGDDTSLLFSTSYYNQNFIDSEISNLVKLWEKSYKKDYPYYFISLSSYYPCGGDFGHGDIEITMQMLSVIPSNYSSFVSIVNNNNTNLSLGYTLSYSYTDGERSSLWTGLNFSEYNNPFLTIDDFNYYLPFSYYDSNFDLKFDLEDTYTITKDGDLSFTLNKNDIIPTYKSLYLDHVEKNYKEIDLNNYSYVALSLKDYSKEEEFNTTVKVKGQYCLTPVYNYGMTERKDILSGTQIERCSPYYDSFTPVRTYILKSDLENHAIYYLKAYDISKENKVQVDTSIFDITYISEENKENPYVTINGKTYPTIPYNSLTDTSTKSEDEGYASGASCAVGDFNCTNNVLNTKGFSWSDIFTSPIDFLKKIWQGIVNVFTLINYFISILPTTLQYFLYISFMLAIILGLIKIIL